MINKEILNKNLDKLKLKVLDKNLDFNQINTDDKMTFIDSYGYKYYLSQRNIIVILRRNGTPAIFFNHNLYTSDNINNYFRLNSIPLKIVTSNPINATDKGTEFICLKHKQKFKRSWNSVKNGSIKCDNCENSIHSYDIVKIKEIVKEKGCIFLSDKFITTKEKYLFQCSCGKTFERSMNVFLWENATKCNDCNNVKRYTTKSVKSELLKYDIKLLSEYRTSKSKVEVEYKCGHKASRILDNIRRSKYSCPYCNKKGFNRSDKSFKKEVYDLLKDEYIVLSKYEKANSKVKMKHNKCGFEWYITPNKFLNQGRRCPICNSSKAEALIDAILRKNNINYKPQYIFDDLVGVGKGLLRFDFAIFDKENIKFLLEYDGEYHYKPINGEKSLRIQQEHDKRKDDYCKLNNIKLIRIPYWEFENIEEILTNEIN